MNEVTLNANWSTLIDIGSSLIVKNMLSIPELFDSTKFCRDWISSCLCLSIFNTWWVHVPVNGHVFFFVAIFIKEGNVFLTF